MKIWHISDTHTFHKLLTRPEDVDMVIFSGDCSNPRDPYKTNLKLERLLIGLMVYLYIIKYL
jgi:3',5'-cyclic AMP phosphodiesterase CpdA